MTTYWKKYIIGPKNRLWVHMSTRWINLIHSLFMISKIRCSSNNVAHEINDWKNLMRRHEIHSHFEIIKPRQTGSWSESSNFFPWDESENLYIIIIIFLFFELVALKKVSIRISWFKQITGRRLELVGSEIEKRLNICIISSRYLQLSAYRHWIERWELPGSAW